MVELSVVAADVMERPCDLLLLKHADGFYGVDALVADRVGFRTGVRDGENVWVRGRGIEARDVLYIGVGPLADFRYSAIREFGRRALKTAAEHSNIRVICTPLHGPGYGLDEREAFLSLVGGFLDGIEGGRYPADLTRIEIIELSTSRAGRLAEMLAELMGGARRPAEREAINPLTRSFRLESISHSAFSMFGAASERKPTLFVAMPFAPEHVDIWEIAIQESCQASGLVCERVDQSAYTGDILSQIKDRLANSSGIIAVLDDANPNVFLEIGFAWGLGKPAVLVCRNGAPLPFDVRGQKCIQYTSISNLRATLTTELNALREQGIFVGY